MAPPASVAVVGLAVIIVADSTASIDAARVWLRFVTRVTAAAAGIKYSVLLTDGRRLLSDVRSALCSAGNHCQTNDEPKKFHI